MSRDCPGLVVVVAGGGAYPTMEGAAAAPAAKAAPAAQAAKAAQTAQAAQATETPVANAQQDATTDLQSLLGAPSPNSIPT